MSNSIPSLQAGLPVRTLDQNCIDDVATSIVYWLGRRHEIMYIAAYGARSLALSGYSQRSRDSAQGIVLICYTNQFGFWWSTILFGIIISIVMLRGWVAFTLSLLIGSLSRSGGLL